MQMFFEKVIYNINIILVWYLMLCLDFNYSKFIKYKNFNNKVRKLSFVLSVKNSNLKYLFTIHLNFI